MYSRVSPPAPFLNALAGAGAAPFQDRTLLPRGTQPNLEPDLWLCPAWSRPAPHAGQQSSPQWGRLRRPPLCRPPPPGAPPTSQVPSAEALAEAPRHA